MQGIIDNAYERSISRCDRDSFASIHNRTVVYEKIVSDSFARRPPYRLPDALWEFEARNHSRCGGR
jgi:hypothetical protein